MRDLRAILESGLGSYAIERELGQGGMAKVFLAKDLRLDRLVALKVLDPELALAVGSERFLREIRVAARLQHPHILTVHDSGEIPGTGQDPAILWFTMPYVEGETLRQRLAREGQLPIADAVTIARETAEALAHAHEHGVIHRDIKPENILLTRGHPMVADFGVARALGDEARRLTGTGLAVGTPAYMSPEQATGSQAVDARSDVYAVGCLLYEMLAGEPPFSGATPMQIVTRAMTEAYRPLRAVRVTVTPGLEQVVARALARTPADRFPTAAELARALAAEGPTPAAVPTAPTPASTVPTDSWPVRRWWAAVIGAMLLGVAVMAYVLGGRNPATMLVQDVIAVAPFDLVSADPELAVWGEGMVDVAARYFDGAGTLRAVAATRAIRAWDGRADRENAERFGRKVQARYVVFGQLVGSDTVRLTATLYDVADSTVLDEHEWRGTARRLDRLADSLATRFLDVLGRTRQPGLARSAPIGSSNPLAIRSFLSGMRDLRRASYAEATSRFLEAVALDTGFVLARMYASVAAGWRGADSTKIRLALEAGARNHGLSARDSLLLLSDSLEAAILTSRAPPFHFTTRLWKVLDALLAAGPDDPEVIYQVMDQNFHYNPLGKNERWHLNGLRRAIELDPMFAPAYEHALELSVMLDPPEFTRSLIRRALAIPGLDTLPVRAMQLADQLLDPALPTAAKQALLDSTPAGPILNRAHVIVARAPDSIGLMAVRAVLKHSPERGRFPLIRQLLYHGRLRDVSRALPDLPFPSPRIAVARELTALGVMPIATFDSLADAQWDRGPGAGGLIVAAPLWLAVGDTLRLDRLIDRMRVALPTLTPVERDAVAMVTLTLEGMLGLARGDSSVFKGGPYRAEWERIAPGMRAETPMGLVPAEVSSAVRGEDATWELLQSRQNGASPTTPMAVLWMLMRARLAEKRGEREIALDDYGFVARLWRDADEPLRSFAREAREGLERLLREPQGGR